MHITGGYHYHTVRADSEEILDRIQTELRKRNYIAPGNQYYNVCSKYKQQKSADA